MNDKKEKPKKPRPTPCESCVFYDYNADDDQYECTIDLDEDELLTFLKGQTATCPYYKYYDEYKSVQKQN